MATSFVFIVSCDSLRAAAAEQVLREAHREVGRLEDALTEYRAQSPVYRFNHGAVGQWVELGPEAWELWQRSLGLAQRTAGAFHPLAKSEGGVREGDVESEPGRLRKQRPGVWLGFGAIGKGFALDRVRTLIVREGFEDFILSAGGSSQILSGFSGPGTPWEWGWSWARDGEGDDLGLAFVHASGEPVALGVSGFHEKGRHLNDPHRGSPSEVTALSALVGAPGATEADALSTALLVGGWERVGDEFPKALAEPKQTRWNGAFARHWGPVSRMAVWALALWSSVQGFADEALEVVEEAVDLSSLGLTEFNPYDFNRDILWVALPLVSLALVLLHLARGPRRRHFVRQVPFEPSAPTEKNP